MLRGMRGQGYEFGVWSPRMKPEVAPERGAHSVYVRAQHTAREAWPGC